MDRLRRRSEFLATQKGKRVSRPSFALAAAPGPADRGPRFGFTVTKKLGNAVVRNRIRRRLKEAVRLEGMQKALPATNYVVIGRDGALTRPFAKIRSDLAGALDAIAAGRPSTTGKAGTDNGRSGPTEGR